MGTNSVAIYLKKKERVMRQTSRRQFGKQLTGTLAAAALTSLVTKAQQPAKTQKPTKQKPKSQREGIGFRTHDTPPPLEFDNGSLVLENVGEFDNMITSGNRREYHINPRTGAKISPAHIRILAGNGEQKFYRDGTDTFQIVIELRDANETPGSSLIINALSTPNQDKFVIDVDSGSEFRLGNHANNDKPTSKKRNRRYRHTAADTLSIYKITVKDTASLFSKTFNVRTWGARGADSKIMIWLEPWV
jgi:hypothetical protein